MSLMAAQSSSPSTAAAATAAAVPPPSFSGAASAAAPPASAVGLRLTERANELTQDLDVADSEGIVRLLRGADAQMFAGYLHHPGVFDDEVLRALEAAVVAVRGALEEAPTASGAGDGGAGSPTGGGIIVCCGSGTSGRLSFVVSRAFNKLLESRGRAPAFHYLVAGGDSALVKAKEGAEDDRTLAVNDLEALLERTKPSHVVLIGISCGLSATYVRAMLDYAFDKTELFTPVVLGFTPPSTAPAPLEHGTVEEGRSGTSSAASRHIIRVMANDASGRSIVIAPAVGPEAVAGSTRMKGGSATKMLLESIFAVACQTLKVPLIGAAAAADAAPGPTQHRKDLVRVLTAYEATARQVYLNTPAIARVVDTCAAALRGGGSISYIGEETAAILGFVDATECPPTFGATLTDVRGFVIGGWETMNNRDGDLHVLHTRGAEGGSEPVDPSNVECYAIDTSFFEEAVLGRLSAKDCVVLLSIGKPSDKLLALGQAIGKTGVPLAFVNVGGEGEGGAEVAAHTDFGGGAVSIQLDDTTVAGLPLLSEFGVKLVLNAASTGAHVRKGTVYRNRMINLTVTNVKLFHRAVGIVQHFSHASHDESRHSLLRAIYRMDEVDAATTTKSIPEHVAVACRETRVLPLALVLAQRAHAGATCTVAEAVAELDAEPVIRNLIHRD